MTENGGEENERSKPGCHTEGDPEALWSPDIALDGWPDGTLEGDLVDARREQFVVDEQGHVLRFVDEQRHACMLPTKPPHDPRLLGFTGKLPGRSLMSPRSASDSFAGLAHVSAGGCAPGPHLRPARWRSLGRHSFAGLTHDQL